MQNEADRKRSSFPSWRKMASAPAGYGCAVDGPISRAPAIERNQNISIDMAGPQRKQGRSHLYHE